eukprot:6619131-Lingulodinium_polyedra.AAC.1
MSVAPILPPKGLHALVRSQASDGRLAETESTHDPLWPIFTAQFITKLVGEQSLYNRLPSPADI